MSVVVNRGEKQFATAQVGKDVIENAEYFISDFSVIDREERDLAFKDKMYKVWKSITLPFWRTVHKVKDMCWEVRYGFERMFNGYDSVDCFETFAKFTERYSKILTEYKKYHMGYPCNMSEEEWDKIIDEMIYHLHYMSEDNVNEELCKDVPDSWIPSWNTADEIINKHKNEFFKLFSEHFYSLWD